MTECGSSHCVTCADEALPLRVTEVHAAGIAVCENGTEVMTDLVGEVHPGEVLLVHAGTALAVLAQHAERVAP